MENQKPNTQEDEKNPPANKAEERTRKIGKIVIGDLFIWDMRHDDALKKIFQIFTPFKAEHLPWKGGIEYTGFSEQFDTIELGNEPPIYQVEVDTKKKPGEQISFVKQN